MQRSPVSKARVRKHSAYRVEATMAVAKQRWSSSAARGLLRGHIGGWMSTGGLKLGDASISLRSGRS